MLVLRRIRNPDHYLRKDTAAPPVINPHNRWYDGIENAASFNNREQAENYAGDVCGSSAISKKDQRQIWTLYVQVVKL